MVLTCEHPRITWRAWEAIDGQTSLTKFLIQQVWVGPTIYIPDKFLVDTDAAGLETTLGEPLFEKLAAQGVA